MKRVENVFAFLTLLFLPTQLGKHFWPHFSYIYSLKIDYLSPTLYFWDILAVSLFITWICKKPKVNQVALNLFFFFLLTQAFSLLSTANIGAGLVRLEQYLIAGLFGVYIASQDFKSLGKIYLPLILGISGEALLAILQFIKGATLGFWILGERSFTLTTPGIAKFDFYGSEFLRPYATFSHPNVLAGFILLGIYLVYVRKRVNIFILILGSITVLLTMSRVAILAGIISLIVLLKRKLIFLALVLLLLSPILFARFTAIFNFDNLTLLRREELIKDAWQMFLKNPILGVGLNNFIPTEAGNLLTGPSRFLQPVHNIFLLVLSETGVIGLIGLIGLIGYPMKKKLNLSWLIILFLGMFDHYFLTLPQGYRLLFLVWGFSLLPRLNRGSMLK